MSPGAILFNGRRTPPISLDLRSDNDRFVDELNDIQRSGGGDWFEKWVEHSLENPEFRGMMERKVAELQRDG